MPETKKSQLLNSLRRFLNDIKSVSCDGVKKDVNVVSVGNVNLGVFYDSKGFAIPNDDYDRLSSGDFSGMIELEEKVLEDDCEGGKRTKAVLYYLSDDRTGRTGGGAKRDGIRGRPAGHAAGAHPDRCAAREDEAEGKG